MAQEYHTLDVFTNRPFTGNPLAVFPDAEELSDAQMQMIAAELGLSETIFLTPREAGSNTWRARIFTPHVELPFAGHPTIGAAILLAERGNVTVSSGGAVVVLEEKVGEVPVRVVRTTRGAFSAEFSVKRRPEFRDIERRLEDVTRVVGLTTDDLLEGWPPQCVSCGVPFLLLGVKDLGALARAHLQEEAWREILAESWAPQIYLFTQETGRSGVAFRARMFAPGMGVIEDPATGAAAAALAASLAHGELQNAVGRRYWTIEQGVEMGRPSQIQIGVEWSAQRDLSIHVAGSGVRVSSGVFYDL